MLVGTAVGGLVVGGLSLRYKLVQLILGSYVFTFIMLMIFLYKADDSILSFISIFFAGLGLYGSTPPAIVWAQKLLPHADSFATSMMLGFTFGLGYVMCVLIGFIGDYIGLLESIRIFAMVSLILACVFILKAKTPNSE
jgi:FSR family fosmidomycin resistance protein-like MFS transporter